MKRLCPPLCCCVKADAVRHISAAVNRSWISISAGCVVWKTTKAYGLSMGGRVVNIEEEFLKKKPAGHFHVDVRGRYIPPGCTGPSKK